MRVQVETACWGAAVALAVASVLILRFHAALVGARPTGFGTWIADGTVTLMLLAVAAVLGVAGFVERMERRDGRL
jgi:hypothetical protein